MCQEAFVGISFPIKMTYSESSRQELSIGLCMGPIRGGGGEVGPRGGSKFWGGGSNNLLGH